MAKEIGGVRELGEAGHTTKGADIMTPQCPENTQVKNTPGVHSFKGTFHDGSGHGGGHGFGSSNSIEGPGVKGQYPIHTPKETKLTK